MKQLFKFFLLGLLTTSSLANAELLTYQPRIIDGVNTSPNKHPSITVILTGTSLCGGTVINPQWILTAGHCVVNQGKLVDLSKVSVGINPTRTEGRSIFAKEWITASKIIVHPNYSLPNNDIALIQLSKATNAKVETLNNDSNGLVGEIATIVGMGSTTRQEPNEEVQNKIPDFLQEAQVPIIKWDICNNVFKGGVPANILCAGYSSRRADVCSGDSGGPMYVQKNGVKVQVGVVSFGAGCGVGNPSGYTDVSKYQSFLERYASPIFLNSVSNNGQMISNGTGLWYDPSKSGTGFNVLQNKNVLSIIYYGYRKNGSPQWLTSTTSSSVTIPKDKVIRLNMNTSTDNNGAVFGKKPVTANNGTSFWGTLEITFTSCTTATARLNGIDGTTSYNLVKLASPKDFNCTQ